MPRRARSPLTLTGRDMDVIAYISALRGVPIEHVAARFFDVDPFTGKKNRNPARACERRVRELVRGGYLQLTREHDGTRRRTLVVLGNAANDFAAAVVHKDSRRARRRRAPVRNGVHHVRTLDALAEIEREIVGGGGRVLGVVTDADIRGEALRARRTQYGDSFPAVPDAVMKVELPGKGVREIAIEYVTSKYTSADIREKHAAFKRYGDVIWVADRRRTAERVKALTGATCRIMS